MNKLIQIQNAIKAARGNGNLILDNETVCLAIDEALDRIEELEDEIYCRDAMEDIENGEGVEWNPCNSDEQKGVNYEHSPECNCNLCQYAKDPD